MTPLPFIMLLACRPDPGMPSYPGSGDTGSPGTGDGGDDDFYDGPDPYQDGEARLSLGAFYEGGASQELPVDDVTRHYYIYSATYTQTVDLVDRVEGYESDVIAHGGGDWWGGGINWDAEDDLSSWTTLHVSLKSSSESFAGIEVHYAGGGVEGILQATDYGYAADGSWHHLAVPLADFVGEGVDLSRTTAPFILVGLAGESGDELRVDNLYYTAD